MLWRWLKRAWDAVSHFDTAWGLVGAIWQPKTIIAAVVALLTGLWSALELMPGPYIFAASLVVFAAILSSWNAFSARKAGAASSSRSDQETPLVVIKVPKSPEISEPTFRVIKRFIQVELNNAATSLNRVAKEVIDTSQFDGPAYQYFKEFLTSTFSLLSQDKLLSMMSLAASTVPIRDNQLFSTVQKYLDYYLSVQHHLVRILQNSAVSNELRQLIEDWLQFDRSMILSLQTITSEDWNNEQMRNRMSKFQFAEPVFRPVLTSGTVAGRRRPRGTGQKTPP